LRRRKRRAQPGMTSVKKRTLLERRDLITDGGHVDESLGEGEGCFSLAGKQGPYSYWGGETKKVLQRSLTGSDGGGQTTYNKEASRTAVTGKGGEKP